MQQPFGPALKIRHNCQTGRYVTIFKAQWSQNTDLPPHFTVSMLQANSGVVRTEILADR